MAIFVGFSKELSRQWRAAVFALAWTVASVTPLRDLFQSGHFGGILGWAISHDWPESIILFMGLEMSPQFLMWWCGLAFYLVMTRFSARRFARGVLISLFFGLLAFGFNLSGCGIVLVRDLPRQAIPFVSSTPFFWALMLSLCGTLQSAATKPAKRIRISE